MLFQLFVFFYLNLRKIKVYNMQEILDAAILGDGEINDDDDDMEDEILLHVFNDNPGKRADLYGRFNFEEVSNVEARSFFRFEKDHIPRLCHALGIPEFVTTPENITLSGVTGLCILLRRLAYPNRLVDLEITFGYSYRALSSIINRVMEIVIDNKGHLLQNIGNVLWLNEEKLQQYSQAIADKGAPMNNIWAFIDGTVRPICRPSEHQQEYYSGYKKVHSVKYQSLLCPDGIIISLKGAFPGHRHDAGMFRESGLYEELEEFTVFEDRHFVIYGDQGYSLRELLIRPFTQQQIAGNPQRQNFNNVMSSLRVTVEWGFSKVLQEFAFVDFKKNQKLLLQEVGTMYHVAVLFTNCHTCLYGSQQSSYFNIEPPLLEVYLGN